MEEGNIQKLTGSESIVASVPKEAFKAMFYLFAGKPDSRSKTLNRKIQIDKQSILDLNSTITEKLKLHHIDQVVTSVVMNQKGKEAVEYGIWDTFESHDFKVPDTTESVLVKWDFLIKLDSYAAPQRHTLTVKVMKSPSPQDMLRRALTDQGDDDENSGLGVCSVRVDFINHILADELINVVERWNRALPKCTTLPSFVEWGVKRDQAIARSIHWSLPFFIILLTLSMIGYIDISNGNLNRLAQVIFISVAGFHYSVWLGRFLASKAYAAINESAEYFPFCITSGDKSAIADAQRSSSKHLRSFLFSCATAFAINMASVIVAFNIGLG